MHDHRLLTGALFIVAAELMFTLMGASIRMASENLNNAMIVFFRNLLGMAILLPWLMRSGLHNFKTDVPHLHLLRGLAGVGAMYCFFYTIAHLTLANAMLLKLTAPLFIPFVALLWLKESFTWALLMAIGIGFAGVAVILSPDFSETYEVSLIALAGGVLAAVAKVTVRRLSRSEASGLIVFYFALVGMLVSLLPLNWYWQTPQWADMQWLIAIGIFATAGQLLLTRGFSCAPAARLGPFAFFSVVFGAILGWLFWEETLSSNTAIGTLLILASAWLTGRQKPTPTAS